ncbi:hypothetical protein [Pseudovibrio sp. Tun.PSC04-5.I4]|uniref:hypothetical protein n=1 Tax=Pseudovibrio sp. Tun.PSC04-5.I4 TaxID=1798213 RepID=UPI0008811E61|nr:hypothetical protein [Pseudovibrio sp. Tun.PSC04-5.I4]SDQ17329.1 hypothetical protein SAMN04515695_0317 [Pseudovibrio sp. Tun.PSC04-5.I4]
MTRPDENTNMPEGDLNTPVEAGVIAKLKAHRAAKQGSAHFTLPETGVFVVYPEFRRHGDWTRSLRIAKNKIGKAQILYLCKIATFDGEKLTEADFAAYIPMNDANELLGEVFGGGDDLDEDDEGNGKTTTA